VVVSVADDFGCTPAQVALAWLVHQPGSVIPIVGARRVEQLDDNLGTAASHNRIVKSRHGDSGGV